MQRTQLEYHHTQGIPTENASGSQRAHVENLKHFLLECPVYDDID
jgi:hypothetical protein